MKILGIALALVLWVSPVLAAVDLPLTVTEPARTARRGAPVTSGVPLPAGTDLAGPWTLVEGTKEIPLQAMSQKGRTPWLLLDFQLDLGSGQTRTLHLRSQAASASLPPSSTPTPPPVLLRVVDATSGETWTGVPDRTTWELQGPIRSVLRIDGRYAGVPGFGYTTRYTFYAGKRTVRIEHVLRNSLAGHERHLKLRSATLAVGEGGAEKRVPRFGAPVVVSGPSTVELLPPEQPGVKEPRKKEAVTVAANGGYLLPDLTHYAATVIHDPGGEWIDAAPVMALAPPQWYAEHGELTTRRFGTLEDERATYKRWGLSWTAKQEPAAPPTSSAVTIDRVDVHKETEADDLWQNLIMYLRTGQYGFFARAHEWAAYYTHEYPYRTDGFAYAWDGAGEANAVVRPAQGGTQLTEADRRYLRTVKDGKVDVRAWGACHFYGWGLLDWAALTGRTDAIEAAVDLAEISRRVHGPRQPHQKWVGHGRGIGRHLLLTVRLWEATQDAAWKAHADHLVALILGSPDWQEAWGIYASDMPRHVAAPFHLALVDHALSRYDEVIGNPEVRRRLVKMAEFARSYALHPKWGHSARTLFLDYPTPGAVSFAKEKETDSAQPWTDTEEPTVNPGHTQAWVDILVRGYRLTQDTTFLDRAVTHWINASVTAFKGGATARAVGKGDVGRFANARLTAPFYFRLNGDIPYVHLLFAETARAATSPAPRSSAPATFSAWVGSLLVGMSASVETSSPPVRLAAGDPPRPAVAPGPASLGDNSWREANPPERRVYGSLVNANSAPEACRRTLTAGNPISRTYTGLVSDGKNVVFLFGGGHASHPGNDVELYRADENRWEVQYEPECPLPGSEEARAIIGTGGGTPSLTPEKRPFTQHTYQYMAYDPVRKRWVGVLASGKATWAYDPATKQWSVLAGPPVGTSSLSWPMAGGVVVYEPVGDKFIALARAPRGSQRGVHVFDPATNKWSFAKGFPADISLSGQILYAAYNPDRREFYVLNYKTSDPASPSKLYRYRPEGHQWTAVDSWPAELRQEAPMFDYDTRNRRVVFLVPPSPEAAAAITAWDPDADKWESMPKPSPVPTGKSMMHRSFVYLADHNVFVFMQGMTNYCEDKGRGGCGGRSRTWLYRYRASPDAPRHAAATRGNS